jgi:hypothetical protein
MMTTKGENLYFQNDSSTLKVSKNDIPAPSRGIRNLNSENYMMKKGTIICCLNTGKRYSW